VLSIPVLCPRLLKSRNRLRANHAVVYLPVCGQMRGAAVRPPKLAHLARAERLPRLEFARPVGKFRPLHLLKLMASEER
jgi:hypothetical protein